EAIAPRAPCLSALGPQDLEVPPGQPGGGRGLRDVAAVPRQDTLDVPALEHCDDALARGREGEVAREHVLDRIRESARRRRTGPRGRRLRRVRRSEPLFRGIALALLP